MRFRGKVAFWWYASGALMLACALVFLVLGIVNMFAFEPSAILLLVLAAALMLGDALFIDGCIRNYVDFREDSLKVRVSVFTETIPYSKISFIRETNSAWASLSTSLDRLQIRYGSYDDILVSVKDKDGFLDEISKRNPQIHIERKDKGDR